MNIVIFMGICIISYFLGCFSTARMVAKSFRSINIYKIGSGLADTENIFSNISKTLGILVAFIDASKVYLFLTFLKLLASWSDFVLFDISIMLFIIGAFMIAGHCLPVTHNFKGGRGQFIYIGLLLVIVPIPMLCIVIAAALIIFFFKQIRFAQIMIVLLPPILSYIMGERFILGEERLIMLLMMIMALLMGVFNFALSKRLGEF